MTDPTTKAPRHSGHCGLLRKSGEVLGRRGKPKKGKNEMHLGAQSCFKGNIRLAKKVGQVFPHALREKNLDFLVSLIQVTLRPHLSLMTRVCINYSF